MFKDKQYDTLTLGESYKILAEDNGVSYVPDADRYEIHDGYSLVMDYKLILKFVICISTVKGDPFVFRRGRWTKANRLSNYYSVFEVWIHFQVEGYIYCPEVEIFFKAISDLDEGLERFSELLTPWGDRSKTYFNLLCEKIREMLGSKDFRRKKSALKKSSKRRYRSVIDYVDEHIQRKAKILVVGVDCHYSKKFSGTITDVEARGHRKEFLRAIQGAQQFDCVLGYIVKMEEGVDKGLHFHCIFLVDGNKRRNPSSVAIDIGEVWRTVVPHGIGYYHDCQRDNNPFKWRNVGLVRYNDRSSVERLYRAIAYLTKPDQYLVCRSALKANVLTMGHRPKSIPGRVGRPRAGVASELGLHEYVDAKSKGAKK